MAESQFESEWCRRLAAAIVEGRFLEDPEGWRDHYATCATCSKTVEGYLMLRRLIEIADPPPATPPQPVAAGVVVRELESRRQRGLRMTRAAWGAGLGCVAVAAVLLLRPGPEQPTPAPTPQAQSGTEPTSASLYALLRGPDGRRNYAQLKTDAALRERFLVALEAEDLGVRRVALMALSLAGCGSDVPRAQIDRHLRELMLTPDQVRTRFGDGGTEVAKAFEDKRAETLIALASLRGPAEEGSPPLLSRETLFALAQDPAPVVRLLALTGLREHGVRAGDERLWALWRDDPDIRARRLTGAILLLDAGPEVHGRMVASFRERPDPELEGSAVADLTPSPEAVDLAQARLADPKTPIVLALAYVELLGRAGVPYERGPLVARALASPLPAKYWGLAHYARAGRWLECRAPLQERWRSTPAKARGSLGVTLLLWDMDRPTEVDLDATFEILEDGETPAGKDAIKVLLEHADPEVRARASTIAAGWAKDR
jgi:hypothetical protein